MNKYYILWAKLEIYYIIHFLSYQFVNYTNKSNSRQRRELFKKDVTNHTPKDFILCSQLQAKRQSCKSGERDKFLSREEIKVSLARGGMYIFLGKEKTSQK